MAGTPKKRATRFGEWEDQLWSLLVELSEQMPSRRSTNRQPTRKIDFWKETFLLLERTTVAASILRHELEEKAGLDAATLQREREVERGLQPQEEPEAAPT